MRLSSFLLLIVFFLSSSNTPLPITKGYFLFPVRPGERNYLSGSMGELRNNHFHGGIDVKTRGEIGWPVYASAEGYISRISMDPAGYGKRIAITHPNGFVTHYAHLDHFTDKIERYVMNEQYKVRKYEIEISPEEGLLRLEKGEIFAYAGNTGSSAGPHLHYEIRDTKDNVYNPLDFGFEEVYDKQAPRIYRMALKPLDVGSTVERKTDKQYYRLGYLNGRYVLNQNVEAFGNVGLEIKAYDRMNGTYNKYGIQEIQVWVDGERYFEQKINFYPILITRQINLHVDYNDVYERGDWYHKCYVSEGNDLPFYNYKNRRGAISLRDGQKHEIQVFVKDSYDNVSLLEFSIEGKKPEFSSDSRNLIARPEFTYRLEGKELRMELSNVSPDKEIEVFGFYKKQAIKPSFITSDKNIYSYKLNNGIPDSIRAVDSTYILPYKFMVPPGKKLEYFSDPVKIVFDEECIHDTLYLKHNFNDSTLVIQNEQVPLFSYMNVEWEVKDPKYIKTHQVYRKSGRSLAYAGSRWKGNKVSFRSRYFGEFVLARDTIAPGVRMIYNTGQEMKLRINDDLSGIKSYDVFINDEWILMEYDAKYNLLTSKRHENSPRIKGKCRIRLEDMAGNVKELFLDV